MIDELFTIIQSTIQHYRILLYKYTIHSYVHVGQTGNQRITALKHGYYYCMVLNVHDKMKGMGGGRGGGLENYSKCS